MAGRAAQLALLGAAVDRLAAGQGRSVLVEGEPGIGKSALVNAVLASARGTGAEVLHGECDELGRRLLPLSAMIRVLGVDPRSTDPLRARLAGALARPGGADSQWLPVNGIDAGVDATEAAVEALAGLVDELCARRPVILAVDDLHYADEATLTLWHRLSQAAEQSPLLLIGALRPSPARAEIDALRTLVGNSPHGSLVPLERLTDEEAYEFATALAGGRPGPGLAAAVDSAAGNPLYIREVVDAAVRSGLRPGPDGVAELSGAVRADFDRRHSASLSAVIADRLAFVSPACRELLQFAALDGVEFGEADAARLAGLPLARATALADEAVAAALVERGGERLRFRHGLIRQALFDAIPEPLRLAVYRSAAVELIHAAAPIERTAEAVVRALEVADGWQLDWLAAHAQELVYRAPQVAATLLEHAVDHCDPADGRVAGFEDLLTVAYLALARNGDAERLTRRILGQTADPERIGPARRVLAGSLRSQGRIDEAARIALEGMGDERIPPLWRVRLAAFRASLLLQTEDGEEAAHAAEAALAAGERLGDPNAQAISLNTLGLRAVFTGRLAEALALFDRALEVVGDDIRLTDVRLVLLANKASACSVLDLHDQTEKTMRFARALAERTGSRRQVMLQALAGSTAYGNGRWDDALAEFSDLTEPERYPEVYCIYHSRSALIAVHRDDEAGIERHLRAFDAAHRMPGWQVDMVPILGARAAAAERAGRPGEAVRILEELIGPDQPAYNSNRVQWLPLLTALALSVDEPKTAARAAETAQAEADNEPVGNKCAARDWCRGLVEQDPEPVERAVAYFDGAGMRYEAGRSREDLALLRARRGQPERARAALVEALSVYSELAASWDARRATARLRQAGVRLGVRGPRQRPGTGWAALSDTEREVAVLVAQGLSNPQIATRLVLSRRTVQTHVSHILAKLGVPSRREIGGRLPARQR